MSEERRAEKAERMNRWMNLAGYQMHSYPNAKGLDVDDGSTKIHISRPELRRTCVLPPLPGGSQPNVTAHARARAPIFILCLRPAALSIFHSLFCPIFTDGYGREAKPIFIVFAMSSIISSDGYVDLINGPFFTGRIRLRRPFAFAHEHDPRCARVRRSFLGACGRDAMQVMMGTSPLKRGEPMLRQERREMWLTLTSSQLRVPGGRSHLHAALLANPKDKRYLCPSRERYASRFAKMIH